MARCFFAAQTARRLQEQIPSSNEIERVRGVALPCHPEEMQYPWNL